MIALNTKYEYYDHMILDSSVFGTKLSSESIQFLIRQSFLVADTFEYELAVLQTVMTHEQAEIFRKNQATLNRTIRMPSVFSPSVYDRNRLQRDVRGLISLITGSAPYRRASGTTCLVVTANLTMIRELIQERAAVDIYDCRTGEMLHHSDFDRLDTYYVPIPDANDPLPAAPYDEDAESMTVYTFKGTPVVLSEHRDDGREAHIYDKCSLDDKLIAKVFDAESLTKGKIHTVQYLMKLYDTLRIEWAMLPVALLYKDTAGREPVGYLMVRAEFGDTLFKIGTYTKDKYWPTKSLHPFSELLQLSLQLARQTMYLSLYDVWPADLNRENFGLPKNGSDLLYMWDTDSFCCAGSETQIGAPDLYHDPDLPPVKLCAHLLYQRVFTILTLSAEPIYHQDNKPETKANHFMDETRNDYYRGLYIPDNLRRLFFHVFVCGYEPSVAVLVQELTVALAKDSLHPATILQTHTQARRLAAMNTPFYVERRQATPIIPPPLANVDLADRTRCRIPQHPGLTLRQVTLRSPIQDNCTLYTNDPFYKY